MIKKILFPILSLALIVFSVSFINVQSTQAATSTFPEGCASGLGYSATNGSPCNGRSTATIRYMAGCTSAVGFSATTGIPCSGSSVAIDWLAGCTSVFGYSSITGEPCNGTDFVSVVYIPPATNPGLPTTGAGGNAPLNMILLLSSGMIALAGSTYLVRNRQSLK